MNTTRSGSLTASGATTTGDIARAQDRGHDRGHQTVPSDLTLRVKALESLLVDLYGPQGQEGYALLAGSGHGSILT